MTVMIIAVVALTAISLVFTTHAQRTAPETLLQGQSHGLLRLFDVSGESNVPEWYSAITLGLSSVLLLVIGLVKKGERDRFAWYWLFMSIVFCFLSLDEAACIHEGVGSLMSNSVKTGGALSYGWVIPWGLFTLGFAFLYFRFLAALPRRTAVLMVISGAIYVGGALGFELLEGYLDEKLGALSMTEVLVRAGEELLEMGGILLFNFTLLRYIETQIGPILIGLGKFSAGKMPEAPPVGSLGDSLRRGPRRRRNPDGRSRVDHR
jgi:hypothetical protein